MKTACHRTWGINSQHKCMPKCTTASIDSSLLLEKRTYCWVLRTFAKSDQELRHVCPSVCIEHFGLNRTNFSLNTTVELLLENLLRKCNCHYNLIRITGTLHEGQFLTISHSFLLRMRNASDQSCREIRTYILCPITFFFENLPSKR